MFSRSKRATAGAAMAGSVNFSDSSEEIKKLAGLVHKADAVLVGAGAGLSASAGFTYSGERFAAYFSDFIGKYGFSDMYSGGFYPFSSLEEHWAYWSRYIYINRYTDAPKPVYERLRALLEDKDYFVLTTNVDHCFRKAGFEKEKLFYTQGDYGLWQCSKPCHLRTYDNEAAVTDMLLSQGFERTAGGKLSFPASGKPAMRVPSDLVPRCPVCGRPMAMNLRSDNTFVEDEGWRQASERYLAFLKRYEGRKLLLLELGVGANTPGIIKYPFWRMTYENPKAVYACVNLGEVFAPKEIAGRAVCIDGDIGEVLIALGEQHE